MYIADFICSGQCPQCPLDTKPVSTALIYRQLPEQSLEMTEAGEAQARRVEAEAASWSIPDLLSLDRATLEELPVLDLAGLREGREGAVEELAVHLKKVFKHTGFFMISNHGCEEEVESTMEASRRFHTSLSQGQKEAMAFGSRGVGYLKINSRLLPKREKGNMNEAFILKQEPGPRNITLDSNPFPRESALPGFKDQVPYWHVYFTLCRPSSWLYCPNNVHQTKCPRI